MYCTSRNHLEMTLFCRFGEPKDAARIAEIHMAAFGSNSMLLAMFPSVAIRQAVQRIMELKALADIQDSNTTVLTVQQSGICINCNEKRPTDNTVVQSEEGAIIAFAKWAHPIEPENKSREPQWIWPKGTALDVLAHWGKLMEEAQAAAIGSQLCYRTSSRPNVISSHHAMPSFLSRSLFLSIRDLLNMISRSYIHRNGSKISRTGCRKSHDCMGCQPMRERKHLWISRVNRRSCRPVQEDEIRSYG
jgi:hypothetical protein